MSSNRKRHRGPQWSFSENDFNYIKRRQKAGWEKVSIIEQSSWSKGTIERALRSQDWSEYRLRVERATEGIRTRRAAAKRQKAEQDSIERLKDSDAPYEALEISADDPDQVTQKRWDKFHKAQRREEIVTTMVVIALALMLVGSVILLT